MSKITQDFYQAKSKKTIKGLLMLFALFLMSTQMSWGQAQVLGAFKEIDGGFEGQTNGAIASVAAYGALANVWTTQGGGSFPATITEDAAIARSGKKCYVYTATGGAKYNYSPLLVNNPFVKSTATMYTIQFYNKHTTGTDAVSNILQKLAYTGNGSTASERFYDAGTSVSYAMNTWVKTYFTFTTSTLSAAGTNCAGVRSVGPGTGITIGGVVDDYVVYAGALDTTLPDAPTSPSILTPLATQMNVTWTAAAVESGNGVDGGGYMVVRGIIDPATSPKVNGIYAKGNTVVAGEQVVYIGAANSFNDTGLSPTTTYYYRIYSVDKAFNYSAPITVNATTTAASYASEPTIQTSSVSFAGVSSTGFTVNFTAGNGTNHLVVVKSGSSVNSDPADGNTYAANTAFGSGAQLGTGNYVVYNGTGNSVVVTGLAKTTTYYVKVYSFNGSTGSENYLITSPAAGNQSTSPGEIVSTGANSAGVTWATASAWVGGVVPGASDNVTIAAGDKILVAASQSCYNLTIPATAKVYNNTALPSGAVQYLTVYGTSLVCHGTLGDKITDGSVDGALGISFNGNLTISGSGLLRPARIRPNTNTQNATLTIDADMQMVYNGSTGTGGAGIYTDNSGNDNIIITVNSGKTLSFVSLSNLNTTPNSSTNGTASTTINVNGTLILPTNSNLSLPIILGKTSTLNVNGTMNVDKLLAMSSSGGAVPTISVGSSGLISVGNLADFSSPTLSAAITGSGTFTLGSGATINIAATSGLEPLAGPVRTTTRNFSTGANYSYLGTAAQLSGSDLPATVYNLTVNNAAGVTLGANTIVNNVLTITTGNLTVPTAKNLTVNNSIANSGTLTVENNANLIQTSVSDTNSGSGTAIIKRNSNSLFRLDYTMWSSPVSGVQTLAGFSPLTSQSPNSRFYTYDAATDLYVANTTPTTSTFTKATGYLIRMPNEDPSVLGTATTYYLGTNPITYNGVFTGVPNNGNVSLASLTSAKFYAVGNPYPSTISANAFINGNSTEGTLYFWRKKNAGAGSAYATYNLVGATVTAVASGNGSEVPNGTIQVGQGFIVKTGVAATTLNFTNAMREASPASTQFFKTRNVVQKDRVWLNLTNNTGVFSQALVGYMDGATQGIDNGIDGKYINDSPIALTSNINNEEYTIQGRPIFDPSDSVALNFKTDVAGDYTIAIDHFDGLFATAQDVFLQDNTTGALTDLKAGAYTFTAAAGVDNARFSMKFQRNLGVNAAPFNQNSVTVYKNKGTLYVNSANIAITNIKVFDVQGRVIAELKNVKSTSASISNLKAANQVLVVKITLQDNKVVTKKVVN